MRSLPKDLYAKHKTLTDGTVKTYYYNRKTKAKIEGEPGTPEFAASVAAGSGLLHEKKGALDGRRALGEASPDRRQDQVSGRPDHWSGRIEMVEARYLSAQGVAEYLSVSRRTVDRWMEEGFLPKPSISRRRVKRWDREAIDRAMAGEPDTVRPVTSADATRKMIDDLRAQRALGPKGRAERRKREQAERLRRAHARAGAHAMMGNVTPPVPRDAD